VGSTDRRDIWGKEKYISLIGEPRKFIGYSANSPVIILTELYQLAKLVVGVMQK